MTVTPYATKGFDDFPSRTAAELKTIKGGISGLAKTYMEAKRESDKAETDYNNMRLKIRRYKSLDRDTDDLETLKNGLLTARDAAKETMKDAKEALKEERDSITTDHIDKMTEYVEDLILKIQEIKEEISEAKDEIKELDAAIADCDVDMETILKDDSEADVDSIRAEKEEKEGEKDDWNGYVMDAMQDIKDVTTHMDKLKVVITKVKGFVKQYGTDVLYSPMAAPVKKIVQEVKDEIMNDDEDEDEDEDKKMAESESDSDSDDDVVEEHSHSLGDLIMSILKPSSAEEKMKNVLKGILSALMPVVQKMDAMGMGKDKKKLEVEIKKLKMMLM